MNQPRYNAIVTSSRIGWTAELVGFDDAQVHAGSLTVLDKAVRELVSRVTDGAGDTARIEIDYDYSEVDEPLKRAALIGLDREGLERRQRELQIASSIQISKAVAAGHSVRTISATLRMSPGRVTQILQQVDPQKVLPDWLVADTSNGAVHSWHFTEYAAENARDGDPTKYTRRILHTPTGWE